VHHRLVDEVREERRDSRGTEIVSRAHSLGGVEPEGAGEHRESPEESLLVGIEQVVRPRDEILQGPVTGDHRGLGTGEDLEPPVEPLREGDRAHRPDASRRELDRER
jgi:hypothetical protein